MFVGSRHEFDVITVEALEAGQHITGQSGVGMANVRRIVNIVNRGRHIIGFDRTHGLKFFHSRFGCALQREENPDNDLFFVQINRIGAFQ